MRPEDDSCTDKVKEMFPRSKFYHVKVGNLQKIKKMTYIHKDSTEQELILGSAGQIPVRYSNLFLNGYINRPVHAEYSKVVELNSPFGIRDVITI